MSKNKQEVFSARFRLNATLQDLVEKKEDGLSDDEGSSSHNEVMMRAPSSPIMTSSKRSTLSRSSNRKRKRKDDLDGIEADQYHHTYVMKLFDRSVDLAQFEENTPLYPICRAWMRNQPHKRDLSQRTPSPEPEPSTSLSDDEELYDEGVLHVEEHARHSTKGGSGRMHNVYRMPSPLTLKIETAEGRDIRIPDPVPQVDATLDINADPERAPPPEQLLLNHMARWKLTRQKWSIASRQNETRFAPSMNILRDMFEQQCKEN